jgi:hypothetical protein
MNQNHQQLLSNAARLRTLATVGKARVLVSQSRQQLARIDGDTAQRAADNATRPLVADLMCRIALKPDGTPFGDDVEGLVASERAEPEIVYLGRVSFRVVDANPIALAAATGALDGDDARSCVLVEFDQAPNQLQPCLGQYLVLHTGIEGVALTFLVWVTHADVREVVSLGGEQGGELNPGLDTLGPNQALLVLEVPVEEAVS